MCGNGIVQMEKMETMRGLVTPKTKHAQRGRRSHCRRRQRRFEHFDCISSFRLPEGERARVNIKWQDATLHIN